MGRKGGNRGLPPWFRGQKYLDDISGEEIYELSSRYTTQRGLRMDKKNYDSLTEAQRAEQITRSIR